MLRAAAYMQALREFFALTNGFSGMISGLNKLPLLYSFLRATAAAACEQCSQSSSMRFNQNDQ